MNEKIKIVFSIFVIFLFIASLTQVIGQNNFENYKKKTSPLYNKMTDKANGKKTYLTNNYYLGKDRFGFINIPRIMKTKLDAVVELIKNLNNAEYEVFVKYFLEEMKKNQQINDDEINDYKEAMMVLKQNPEILKASVRDDSPKPPSFFDCPTSIFNWVPTCGIINFFKFFINIACIILSGGTSYTIA